MTSQQIQEQVDAIREVSAELLKDKKRARQFLIEAGIIREDAPKPKKKKRKK
jgi:hypothetical protein